MKWFINQPEKMKLKLANNSRTSTFQKKSQNEDLKKQHISWDRTHFIKPPWIMLLLEMSMSARMRYSVDHYQKLIKVSANIKLQTIKAKATMTAVVTKPVMVIVIWDIKYRQASGTGSRSIASFAPANSSDLINA